ncbi:MAG: hypothetical protein HUN04_20110 [Desulfobacter sp.]|nr:MAG: hypothetical protein HUN04_20110 [Desulfobacter sp.]
MPGYLNRLYLKFIRPVDPGLFIAKYAGKAAVACLAAFLAAFLSGVEGPYFFWWMAGAVCTVLFRTGSTHGRRKVYALVLLGTAAVAVPAAALAGNYGVFSLVFIFVLSFVCFFVSSMGVSASTLGTGCIVVSLISVFSPAELGQGLLRSACLLSGGMISFWVIFYLWPFDPEKVLLSSAKLAVEDMGAFFRALCARMGRPETADEPLTRLSATAVASVRRYRIFLESFNIDPLKGCRAAGGPGLFYFGLIRLFESLTGLLNHIHFSDNRPEFDGVRKAVSNTAEDISRGFDAFSGMKAGRYERPDFDKIIRDIEGIEESLWNMGAYRRGDEVRDKYLDAWAAVYELKNVAEGQRDMMSMADQRFRLGKK